MKKLMILSALGVIITLTFHSHPVKAGVLDSLLKQLVEEKNWYLN